MMADGRHFSFRCSTGTTSPSSKTGRPAWLSDSTMHLQLLQNFLQWHCCRCFEGDICEKARHACTEFRDNCPDDITPPHLQHSHGENSPQLSGLPASADRATRLGEVPHFTCERNQEIKRDCMERLVTPPKRGTSPSWGPPPPCEQALSVRVIYGAAVFIKAVF